MKNAGKEGRKVTHNYNRLIGKIAEVCGTRAEFAKRLDMAAGTLTNKLAGRTDFTQGEIDAACELLGINKRDIPAYFFA